jgi:hypothetical protein
MWILYSTQHTPPLSHTHWEIIISTFKFNVMTKNKNYITRLSISPIFSTSLPKLERTLLTLLIHPHTILSCSEWGNSSVRIMFAHQRITGKSLFSPGSHSTFLNVACCAERGDGGSISSQRSFENRNAEPRHYDMTHIGVYFSSL